MRALFVGGSRHGQVLEVPPRREYKVPVPSTSPIAEASIEVYSHQVYSFAIGAIDIFVLNADCEWVELADALAIAAKIDIRRPGDND